MTNSMATRAVALCDVVFWVAKLNALWLFFTLLGGVVLGIGPSTSAAFAVARRYHRGDTDRPLAHFWAYYRAEFLRGNALGLPVLFAAVMLWLNYRYFDASTTPGSGLITGAIVVVAVWFAATVCILLPMISHYDLPLLSYYAKASEFALRNVVSTVLVLFVTAAVVFASYRLPGLLLFLSVGAWIHLDSYLCLKFFAGNDSGLAGQLAQTAASPPSAAPALSSAAPTATNYPG